MLNQLDNCRQLLYYAHSVYTLGNLRFLDKPQANHTNPLGTCSCIVRKETIE